ncbi:Dentin sialophosphoprotein-related, putative isoform 2 [Hibiscus syriacus]|uniref:Dentin sialophosphoprotein-related, putative isoform 2 n=1 Tax=Hibiscus syriacus TaxID=106335 RepID=A0A6A3A675_HIBSY|nr:Dentin sialophosphoprotein-related, putative isoform 2 [Hibiscus syriacus]
MMASKVISSAGKNCFTVIIFNIPELFHHKGLWLLFDKYGEVVDSFIPNKRSKGGSRFGFVPFTSLEDARKAISCVDRSRIRGNEVRVFLARFQPRAAFWRKKFSGLKPAVSKSIGRMLGIQRFPLWVLLTRTSFQLVEAACSRRAWLSCKGIPPFLWNPSTFRSIADKWGELISIEEGSVNPGSFDRALFQIITNCQTRVEESVVLKAGDLFFTVFISEFEPCFSPDSVWADSFLMDEAVASPFFLVGELVGVSPVISPVVEVCLEGVGRNVDCSAGRNVDCSVEKISERCSVDEESLLCCMGERFNGCILSGGEVVERNIGEDYIMGLRNNIVGMEKISSEFEDVVEHEIVLEHAVRESVFERSESCKSARDIVGIMDFFDSSNLDGRLKAKVMKNVINIIKKRAISNSKGMEAQQDGDVVGNLDGRAKSGCVDKDLKQILRVLEGNLTLPNPLKIEIRNMFPFFPTLEKESTAGFSALFVWKLLDVVFYFGFFGSSQLEGPANSTSDSGSDSDSDNDSSDSGSHNRGASPAASGSGSSSDSESDASSNSKEGSDEDVDIMTSDDDKETKQDIPTSEPGLLTSPVTWQAEHDRSLQNGMDENHDDDGSDAVDIEGNGSDAVDIEQDLPEDEQEIEMAANTNKECEKHEEGTKPSSSDHDEFQGCQNFIGNLFDDTENMVTDNIRNEQSDYSVKSKGKSKRGSDSKHIYEKSKHSKRLKFESISQSLVSGSRDAELFGSSRPIEEPYQSSNKGDKDYADSQKGYNQVFPRKSSTYFHQSCRKSSDPAAWTKAGNTAERPLKHTESSIPGSKFTAKNVHEGYVIQKDNPSRDTQNEDGLMKGKNSLTNPKSGARGKDAVPSDFQHMKHGETVGKSKDSGHISGSYINYSLKDNNRSSGRPSTSENSNPDLSKGKPFGNANRDSGKSSSPNLSGLRRTPEHLVEDLSRSHHRVVLSQKQQLSRFDRPEFGSQFNRLADNGKTKQTDTAAKLGVGLEDYGESHKKAPASSPQQKVSKRGLASQFMKESKIPTSNKMLDTTDMSKDVVLKEGNANGRKKRGSSDEDYLPYFKYEKDEPEHKGLIKDSSHFSFIYVFGGLCTVLTCSMN